MRLRGFISYFRNHFIKEMKSERGTWGAIAVGTAAVAGAGGGLAYMGSKKKAESYPSMPGIEYRDPHEMKAGATALPILQSRAKGEGVGFTPEQLSMYGNPYAESVLRNYQTKLKPQLEESFASRGLSRSTMAPQAEANAYGDVLSDIGVNWADLNKWNETMRQQGITNAMGGLMDYMGTELNQSNRRAEVPLMNYRADLNRWANVPNEYESLGQGISTAANIYSGLGGGMGGGGSTPTTPNAGVVQAQNIDRSWNVGNSALPVTSDMKKRYPYLLKYS
jgi:hypothetical protein